MKQKLFLTLLALSRPVAACAGPGSDPVGGNKNKNTGKMSGNTMNANTNASMPSNTKRGRRQPDGGRRGDV